MRIERSVHPSYRGISVITPLPLGEGKGEGPTGSWLCEVTPFGLLMIGDGPLNIWRTCGGISVITPLSIRRGAGGEAAKALAGNR